MWNELGSCQFTFFPDQEKLKVQFYTFTHIIVLGWEVDLEQPRVAHEYKYYLKYKYKYSFRKLFEIQIHSVSIIHTEMRILFGPPLHL